MKFEVRLTARAERDVKQAYEFIAENGPANADDWREGLRIHLQSLEQFPERCGLAPESAYVDESVHQTYYAKFRILFTISERTALVMAFRHGARQPMTKDEFHGQR